VLPSRVLADVNLLFRPQRTGHMLGVPANGERPGDRRRSPSGQRRRTAV
jgi:hypothetical protein